MGGGTTASGSYSTAMGYSTNAIGNHSTAMGSSTTASGSYSTALGYQTTASGNYSTAMGKSVSTNNKSGAFIIGDNSTNTIMNAALDNNFRARFAGGYRLYTSSDYTTSAVLFSNDNAWSTTSDKYSKEKFEDVAGEDFLKKIASMKLTTWNYKTQNPQKFRHYGPMAQDFYAAFGKDKYGTIGNDSTINQADFDGINLIAIQALEKRTTQQKENMEKDFAALKKELEDLKAIVLQQKKELDEHKAEKNPCNLITVNEKKE
jgi:DNA-binding transcriptional MerR regulator